MRLRLAVLLVCAATAPLALAGGVSPSDTQPPGVTVLDVLRAIPLGTVLLVVIACFVLFKLFSRWPQYERWLVGAALLALPPAATYGGFFVSWFHLYTGSTTPVRDTGIFWVLIALALALAWWLLKTRTTMLGSPGEPVAYQATRPLAATPKEAAVAAPAAMPQRREATSAAAAAGPPASERRFSFPTAARTART